MKKYLGFLTVILIATLLLIGCNKTNEPKGEGTDKSGDVVVKAEQFIDFLAEGKYEEATEGFDETMKDALTPNALEELWGTLNEQAGNFIDQEYDSTEQQDGYEVVLINGLFEGDDVVFIVTFDDKEQIVGFFIQ